MTSPRYPIHLASSHFYPRTWEPYLIPIPYQQITVRDGKGAQDRVTMLPQ